MPLLGLPEGRLTRLGQGVLLRVVPRAHALDDGREHAEQERCFGLGPFRLERHAREREVAWIEPLLRSRRLRLARIRVDEGDVQAGALTRGDEEELIALRKLSLDDRGRDPRQQVALHRPLERARAELGAEALLDQEVDRGLVPLDRPGLHPQATPRAERR